MAGVNDFVNGVFAGVMGTCVLMLAFLLVGWAVARSAERARGRRFELHRDFDVSGVSGEGVVADGWKFGRRWSVTFPDGTRQTMPAGWCLIRWRGDYRSTVLWDSVDEAMAVHGHNGATRLVWLDGEVPEHG